ncbi:MAG: hypothetical protein ACYCXW_01950 [Solirubrobacteraceae bacterium]
MLLVLKGFASDADGRSYSDHALERGVAVQTLSIDDRGLDLTAYARVVDAVAADSYCFLNSFAQVLSDGWLGQLSQALDGPKVGIAGATGSWASHQDYRRYQLGLPSGYEGIFDGREAARRSFLKLAQQHNPAKRDNGRLAHLAVAAIHMMRDRGAFDHFPARHIRTNGFAVRRETALKLGMAQIRTKRDAYRLESGPGSATRRVEQMGLRAVVVGRDGRTYDPGEWPESLTLWQEGQQNLLIADNQTDDYERAEPAVRRVLSQLAWGGRARPR